MQGWRPRPGAKTFAEPYVRKDRGGLASLPWAYPGTAKANKMVMLPITPTHAEVTTHCAHLELAYGERVKGEPESQCIRTFPKPPPHVLPGCLGLVSDEHTKRKSKEIPHNWWRINIFPYAMVWDTASRIPIRTFGESRNSQL
jgi:hypothetical protein